MAFQLPTISTRTISLGNGVRVVSIVLRHLARSHIGVTLKGGPVYETDETWGLSHVLEHMVFRGTASYPTARAVGLAADACGGSVDGATYRDRVLYDMRVDPDRIEQGLFLLAEMLSAPRLKDLDIEKQVVQEELLESRDEAGQDIDPDNWAYKDLFGDTPLARTIEGTAEQVHGFTRTSLRRFLKSHYGARHMVVVICSPHSHALMQGMAERTFGTLKPGDQFPEPDLTPIARSKTQLQLRVVRTQLSQTHVRLCFPCGSMSDSSKYELMKLWRVLDDGPAARFQTRLIDGKGLAYALWASLDLYEKQGVFEIGAQVEHGKVFELVDAILAELGRAAKRAPQKAEIDRVESRYLRNLRDLRDQPEHLVEVGSRLALFGHGFDRDASAHGFFEVTPGQVRERARQLFLNEKPAVVLVGQPARTQVKSVRKRLSEHWS
jgi:predicted Zn-dependent peptidase